MMEMMTGCALGGVAAWHAEMWIVLVWFLAVRYRISLGGSEQVCLRGRIPGSIKAVGGTTEKACLVNLCSTNSYEVRVGLLMTRSHRFPSCIPADQRRSTLKHDHFGLNEGFMPYSVEPPLPRA
jgi:hypothetical protein